MPGCLDGRDDRPSRLRGDAPPSSPERSYHHQSPRATAQCFGVSPLARWQEFKLPAMTTRPLRDKPRERFYVLSDARALKGGKTGVAVLDADHRPGIAAGGEHRIS